MPSTTRRRLVVALAFAGAVPSLPGRVSAQPMRRIGYLANFKAPAPQSPVWLRDRLKALGFEEGRNLVIERGFATNENLDATARGLVARGVEVIVASSNAATEAALNATRTIPIVMVFGIAPLEAGLVQSLSRPGGNVTGNAFYSSESVTKSFEMLLEAFPKARRAGMLWLDVDRRYPSFVRARTHAKTKLEQLAAERHIAFQTFDIGGREEAQGALSRVKAASLDVLLVSTNDTAFEVNGEIAGFALKERIPTIGGVSDWVDLGGLFYFGPDEQEPIDRAPRYVAQLLRGAKAAELAMELPSMYHLSINMKTARSLGYAIPDALRIRADRILG